MASARIPRRTVLASMATAGAGVVLAHTAAASPTRHDQDATQADGLVAHESFTVVDRRGRQRLRVDSRRAPIIIGGHTFPADARQSPPDATHLIFNDDEGSEKGGVVASTQGAWILFDYSNADALFLGTEFDGARGAAVLALRDMPDPALPPDQAAGRERALLGWATEEGALLSLTDSHGRPRIVLRVDPQDVPSIQVLDETGAVVGQVPIG